MKLSKFEQEIIERRKRNSFQCPLENPEYVSAIKSKQSSQKISDYFDVTLQVIQKHRRKARAGEI